MINFFVISLCGYCFIQQMPTIIKVLSALKAAKIHHKVVKLSLKVCKMTALLSHCETAIHI